MTKYALYQYVVVQLMAQFPSRYDDHWNSHVIDAFEALEKRDKTASRFEQWQKQKVCYWNSYLGSPNRAYIILMRLQVLE